MLRSMLSPEQRQTLKSAKRLPLALLLFVALGFVASSVAAGHWQQVPLWLACIKAVTEASLVGALADWFAVSALFRHIPLPVVGRHTAIIPRNKDRIGLNLANFVRDKFLDGPSLVALIERHDPARVLAGWLTTPANSTLLGRQVARLALAALEMVQDRQVERFLSHSFKALLEHLDLPFEPQRYAGQNYPGSQTAGQPCQQIMERIATALGRPIRFISPDNGSYRLSHADATARTDIHVDNETGDNFQFYAGVLYLNPPEQCQGGTTFWRHQPSGWYRRLPEAQVKAGGYASFKEFQKRWLPNSKVQKFNQLQEQRDSWAPLLEVPMRHNRLIMYKGHYFHSLSNVFGDTRENGRLVQLFFFEVPE